MTHAHADALLQALNRIQAVIEFDPEGRILAANDRFLALLGYERDAVVGRHHRIFCLPGQADSPAYRSFWEALARGEVQDGQFARLTHGGRTVWLQASYNPILGPTGASSAWSSSRRTSPRSVRPPPPWRGAWPPSTGCRR